MPLVALGGGATHGLVRALAAGFEAETGTCIGGTFGAIGAMREKLEAGEAADLLLLSRPMIDELERAGHVLAGSARDIGSVPTSIAVRTGDPLPLVGTVALLTEALGEADELFVPDTRRSTAGIHVAAMLENLGLGEAMAARLHEHPNGAAAMAALARARSARPIGCTQRTEILATPGVTLVRDLPAPVGLDTVYTAAVATRAAEPRLAARLIAMLTAAEAREARRQAGFDEMPVQG